jgi:hypothetical protein
MRLTAMTKESFHGMTSLTRGFKLQLGRVWPLPLALAAFTWLAMLAGSPYALASGPQFGLIAEGPTTEDIGHFTVMPQVQNIGDAETSGPLTMHVELPSGVRADLVFPGFNGGENQAPKRWVCPEEATSSFDCTYPANVRAREMTDTVVIDLVPSPGVEGTLTVPVTVSGGGAPPVTADARTTIGPAGAFGITGFEDPIVNQDGSPSTQAGAAPYAITTKISFKTYARETFPGYIASSDPVQDFRNVHLDLPPGFVGYPQSIPRCSLLQLSTNGGDQLPACPTDTQIGVAAVRSSGTAPLFFNVPLYNIQPFPGSPAAFGFYIEGVVVLLNATLRDQGDYGVTVNLNHSPNPIPLLSSEVTVWGVPYDHGHDNDRFCRSLIGPEEELVNYYGFNGGPKGVPCEISAEPTAFLRNPTSCPGTPLRIGLRIDDYPSGADTSEASYLNGLAPPDQEIATGTTGCDRLPFTPSISIEPTGTQASAPTGVDVRVSLPQLDSPYGLAEADLKKAVVTMPDGMTINPSAADGLGGCSDAQFGIGTSQPAACPDDSKLGSVSLHTPLLPHAVEGGIYVLSQRSSDPASGEMVRIGIELREDSEGVDVKLLGHVSVNPVTGQLTTTFDDAPQLPFSDITLQFKGGARAPLLNPPECGPQTIAAQISSWARPDSPVTIANTYDVTSGPGGMPCGLAPGFSPSLFAGTENPVAGAFTPFTMTFTRPDGQQALAGLQIHMPPGLLGKVRNVTPCAEPASGQGTCGPESLLGTVTVGVGAGSNPFYLPGRIYLTGSYKGAPFGLSVVVPAVAGPFDLGNVVVRGTIQIDPYSAALTITTDPLPQIVAGIPVFIRTVTATVDREQFMFNPTSCEPMALDAILSSAQGATAKATDRFQVGGCSSLRFKPRFRVSTAAHTSRKLGASLDAKLTVPAGNEANFAKVKVELPKQLPSRLTTLQKACPDETFNADPARCPAGSRVGIARAATPLLASPLTGPVFFVSHGGAAFPVLDVVLQTEGIRVDLLGATFISKAGITSSTFNSLPDVPVESFELYLPRGPGSALAANGSPCKSGLKMPTTFTAQNGAVLRQAIAIGVAGCPKTGKAKARRAAAARPPDRRHRQRRGPSGPHAGNGRGK